MPPVLLDPLAESVLLALLVLRDHKACKVPEVNAGLLVLQDQWGRQVFKALLVLQDHKVRQGHLVLVV